VVLAGFQASPPRARGNNNENSPARLVSLLTCWDYCFWFCQPGSLLQPLPKSVLALAVSAFRCASVRPALPVYEQPLCPGDGLYVGPPGYWAWSDDDGYYWVPGNWWKRPMKGLLRDVPVTGVGTTVLTPGMVAIEATGPSDRLSTAGD